MASKIRNAFMCSVITALMVMSLTPATAHLQTKGDPNDATGPLDIRTSSFNDINGDIRVTLKTRSDWNLQTLDAGNDDGDSFFRWQFNSKGGNGSNGRFTDYFVIADNIKGKLSAALFRWVPPYPTDEFEFIKEVSVSKDGRAVKARFKAELIDPRSNYIDWNAESWYQPNNGPCSGGCYDGSPSPGLHRHNL